MSLPKWVRFGIVGLLGAVIASIVGEAIVRNFAASTQTLLNAPIAPPPPPLAVPGPPDDLRQRLVNAHAKSGDLQFALYWFNKNDIDLWVTAPDGRRVGYGKHSQLHTQGHLDAELDVDRNVLLGAATDEPVENIYWQSNRAMPGKYRVEVNYYNNHPGIERLTRCKVYVFMNGTWLDEPYCIDLTTPDPNPPRKFELVQEVMYPPQPQIRLAASSVAEIYRGSSTEVQINIQRRFFSGPIILSTECPGIGDLAQSVSVPSWQDRATLSLKVPDSALPDNYSVKITAKAGEAKGETTSALKVLPVLHQSLAGRDPTAILLPAIWSSLVAIGLSLGILLCQSWSLRRRVPPVFQTVRLIAVSGVAGFLAGALGQAAYIAGDQFTSWLSQAGFALGWTLLGCMLGGGAGLVIPNLRASRAAIAGMFGGMLAAGSMLGLTETFNPTAGRILGAAALGLCVSTMVSGVEQFFRSAWLVVRFGQETESTINLGTEPILLGSGSRCHIWIRDTAGVASRIWVENQSVLCEDSIGQMSALHNGQELAFGAVCVTVRISNHSAHMPAPGPSHVLLPEPPKALGFKCTHCGFPLPDFGRPGHRYCSSCCRTS